MKLEKFERIPALISYSHIVTCLITILLLSVLFMVGCGDHVVLPSPNQLVEFNNAGPIYPSLDIRRLVKAEIKTGSYRVVPGDVLELTMPAIIRYVTAEEAKGIEFTAPYLCRVNENGVIILPIIGEIEVTGRILSQIESSIVDAYYPEYVVTCPSVFARVHEYKTAKVSITGAVERPGIYSLRSDQMSLVALLMEAGGIVDEGAAVIRIVHRKLVVPDNAREFAPGEAKNKFRLPTDPGETVSQSETQNQNGLVYRRNPKASVSEAEQDLWLPVYPKQYCDSPAIAGSVYRTRGAFANFLSAHTDADILFDKKAVDILNQDRGLKDERITESGEIPESEAFVLPIRGLNTPFTDVVLRDGDSVIVERLQPPLFSVVGLVNTPGNFPYPPDTQYNLLQALAFAGGLDRATEPRYATIYRLKPDHTIVSAVFEVVNIGNGSRLTNALNTRIKVGDIIAVEHTPRTRTKLFLDTVFRINIGTYWRLNDAWEE